ncbi:MAG: hypothetical protein IH602_08975 [Bryobacteraceae bacterium]|nr:hypothetical protein [Bryobacteraceae bacterium]
MRLRIIIAAQFLGIACAWAQQPVRGGALRLAIQAEPRNLDPAQASDEPSELVRYLTGGVLIRMNRLTQRLEPALAEQWSYDTARRTLTLRLRAGVRFSDGTPFNAADVCHTFSHLLDPAVDAPSAEPFRSVKGGTRCEVRDARTVALRFGEPIAAVERLLDDVAIQSSRSKDQSRPTLGPFFISDRQPGASLVLRRNPNYWRRSPSGTQLPYLDSIRLDIQRNRDSELVRFRAGELHLINNLDSQLYERLKSQLPGSVRDLGVSNDTEQLWFNQIAAAPLPAHKKVWFRSTEFRKAVSEAINRNDIARVVFKGHATAAVGPVSSANHAWLNAAIETPRLNLKSALNRLSGSGFRLRDGILYDRAGNPVEFSLITNAGNRSREQMAALIQADLKRIGIRVTIAPLDFPALIGRITRTFDYDACLLGLVMTDLDPIAQTNVWLSSGPQHQWNPSQSSPETPWEAEIDRMMHTVATEANAAARKRAFDRVQQIIAENVPFIYLINRHALVAVAPDVRNAQPAVLRPQTLWNIDQLWLASPAQVPKR